MDITKDGAGIDVDISIYDSDLYDFHQLEVRFGQIKQPSLSLRDVFLGYVRYIAKSMERTNWYDARKAFMASTTCDTEGERHLDVDVIEVVWGQMVLELNRNVIVIDWKHRREAIVQLIQQDFFPSANDTIDETYIARRHHKMMDPSRIDMYVKIENAASGIARKDRKFLVVLQQWIH